ncbi:MAG TPA: hypothetical protein VGG18_00440 [Granulicella sp.]
MSPQSEKDANGAGTAPSATAIREQLGRLLAHPLFTNSKRYPVLLAYTVEQTLLGKAGELKERTIGVEAFGREPSYDVNLDPVVRTTAAEVRKRLIQYYYNTDHAGELLIELPVGSYIPYFREPAAPPQALPQESPGMDQAETASVYSASYALVDTGASSSKKTFLQAMGITAGLIVAGLIGFGIGHMRLPNKQPATTMERFWEPIAAGSNRITYCLGQPFDAVDRDRTTPDGMPLYGNLAVSDVITLARSIVPLVPRNIAFRVVADSDISFEQLRESPFVLIGAFDNVWTMRITQDLPFGFEYDSHGRRLVDRKSSPKKSWTLQWQAPSKLAKDYAIVARIHDKVTGQPVMIIGGILGEGTEAASEVVSNPAYLDEMLKKAPKNWDQLNLEAIIETNVIEGHAGPPTVLAVETW